MDLPLRQGELTIEWHQTASVHTNHLIIKTNVGYWFFASLILNRKQLMFLFYLQGKNNQGRTAVKTSKTNGLNIRILQMGAHSSCFSWMNGVTTLHQSSLSLHQMETNSENHNWTQCRDQHIKVSPDPMDTSMSELLHPWFKEHHSRADGRIARVRTPGCPLWHALINECINKTRTIAMVMDMLTWKRENFMSSHS